MRIRCAALLTLISALGCGRVSYEARGATDGGRTGLDAEHALDATARDAAGPGGSDTGAPAEDALVPALDAPAPPLRCPTPESDVVVGQFEFEAGALTDDALGAHEGMVVGGALDTTTGPSGCGSALLFPEAEGAFFAIADSPEWDLTEGSVDFWVRFDVDASAGFVTLVSRDASGNNDGHFSVYRVQDGTIVARLQTVTESVHHCANTPSPEGVWTHVGVNVGPAGFELWVNGERATRTDEVAFESPTFPRSTAPCGEPLTTGLAGNDNPWMFGVNGSRTDEGALTPLRGEWFRDGAIDHFRVSRVRRDFSEYAEL